MAGTYQLSYEAGEIDRRLGLIEGVTSSKDGLMLSTDKVKLDGIEEGAEKNIVTAFEPGDANSYLKAVVDDQQYYFARINNNTWRIDPQVLPLATATVDGAMSAADKSKLDNLKIPTKVSELTNDSGYLTSVPNEYITETELNSKGYLTQHQDLSSYALKTSIPTKVSALTNDSGYLTSIPSEYVTEAELNSKGYLTGVPSEYVTDTELNNKGYLTSIPSEYVTETELNEATKGVTTDKAGLMSAEDKVKLDGIDEGAQKNVVTAFGYSDAPGYLKATSDNTDYYFARIDSSTHCIYPQILPLATTTTSGAMSASDKVKLDNLSEGGGGNSQVQFITWDIND